MLEENEEGKIKNPETGRFVLKDGKIGKALIKKYGAETKKVEKKTRKKSAPAPAPTPAPAPAPTPAPIPSPPVESAPVVVQTQENPIQTSIAEVDNTKKAPPPAIIGGGRALSLDEIALIARYLPKTDRENVKEAIPNISLLPQAKGVEPKKLRSAKYIVEEIGGEEELDKIRGDRYMLLDTTEDYSAAYNPRWEEIEEDQINKEDDIDYLDEDERDERARELFYPVYGRDMDNCLILINARQMSNTNVVYFKKDNMNKINYYSKVDMSPFIRQFATAYADHYPMKIAGLDDEAQTDILENEELMDFELAKDDDGELDNQEDYDRAMEMIQDDYEIIGFNNVKNMVKFVRNTLVITDNDADAIEKFLQNKIDYDDFKDLIRKKKPQRK